VDRLLSLDPWVYLVTAGIVGVIAFRQVVNRWWWIDVGDEAQVDDKVAVEQAKADAKASDKGVLHKQLGSTEKQYRWVLLYNHVRVAQIAPGKFKRIRRADLNFLVGMSFPHPDLTDPKQKGESVKDFRNRRTEITKLQGNVARAKEQLRFRNLLWTAAFTVAAAFGGALVGSLMK
jgi:hypothetical protein